MIVIVSMVVDQVDIIGVTIFETKDDSPKQLLSVALGQHALCWSPCAHTTAEALGAEMSESYDSVPCLDTFAYITLLWGASQNDSALFPAGGSVLRKSITLKGA